MSSTPSQTETGKELQLVERLQLFKQTQKDIKTIDSVQRFRNKIFNTQTIKQLFEGAISQIPEYVNLPPYGIRKGILFNKTIQQALDLLNIAVQFPPNFTLRQKCGVPVNFLFADLLNTKLGPKLFSHPGINEYLKDIVDDYAKMLKTQKSLRYFNNQQGGWFSELAMTIINYDEFICDKTKPYFGFKCWNDWFIRQLKEGVRPIDEIDDPLVIINSSQNYPLTHTKTPVLNVKSTDNFWLKQNSYSLYDMFEADKSGVKQMIDQSFVGGTIYQGFLSLWCYHHWHSPVSGIIQRSYRLPGCYFLKNPNIAVLGQNNFVSSQVFMSCVATRHIFIINTENQLIGRVGIIQIGMGQVSSCIPIVKEGERVKKGQCIGRFQFGGSSHVIVFDRKAKLEFNPKIYQREIINGISNSKIQKVNSWLARISPS